MYKKPRNLWALSVHEVMRWTDPKSPSLGSGFQKHYCCLECVNYMPQCAGAQTRKSIWGFSNMYTNSSAKWLISGFSDKIKFCSGDCNAYCESGKLALSPKHNRETERDLAGSEAPSGVAAFASQPGFAMPFYSTAAP